MNGKIKVTGGIPLVGEVKPVPNKNAIVVALPASILSNEDIIYKNVPKSTDVEKILELLKLLGAKIDDSDFDNLVINCKNLKSYKLDKDLGTKIRASILFAGPLLARFGIAEIPIPGGCVLGKRSISAHIDIFQKVDVAVTYLEDGYVRLVAPQKNKTKQKFELWQSEASVTATENFAMYAAGVNSQFELIDSACEPHVSQLMNMLSDMGANIDGIGSNKIIIKGNPTLKGVHFEALPDHIDIAGYIVASALTKGNIKILNANIPEIIGVYTNWFPKFGINVYPKGKDLIADGTGELKIDLKESGFPLATENLPKFAPRPWPGYPVDALPQIIALACKLDGRLLVQNWMYETGLDFIQELNKLGANIFVCDPQRVIVSGPINFKGGEVVTPAIIQASMSIFLASLSDPVETTLHGVDVLKRRYPNIYDIYSKLGAKIQILDE